MPNHPHGVIFPEYRRRVFLREQMDGMKVLRTWLYAAPNRGFWRWAAKHLSFSASSLLASTLAGSFDVIVVGSASLFLGLSAFAISRFKRVPWVMTVSDLWPETAIAQGRLSNRALIGISNKLAAFVYRHADLVVGVTRNMCQAAIDKGASEERVLHVPNGVDTDVFHPEAGRESLRKTLGIEGKFVVMYAGSMGPAHGLEAILDSAKLFRAESAVRFALVGDGSVKAQLVEKAKREMIDNVLFVDRQSQSVMSAVMNAADVILIPQRNSSFFSGVVPFKMAEAMACGRPIVMASPRGEATEVVEQAGAGIVVNPESAAALAEAIRMLKASPEMREEMGRRGREYAVEHLDRTKLAKRLEQVLLDVVESHGRDKNEQSLGTAVSSHK